MNKSILITGSSQRIGKELSLYFAKMGWNIAIHFNKSKKQANILKREIERYGVKCICIQGNLLNVKTIKKIIAAANKKLGNINCIINNASMQTIASGNFNYSSIVFAGYGIVDTEKGINDYANLDVKGKEYLWFYCSP